MHVIASQVVVNAPGHDIVAVLSARDEYTTWHALLGGCGRLESMIRADPRLERVSEPVNADDGTMRVEAHTSAASTNWHDEFSIRLLSPFQALVSHRSIVRHSWTPWARRPRLPEMQWVHRGTDYALKNRAEWHHPSTQGRLHAPSSPHPVDDGLELVTSRSITMAE